MKITALALLALALPSAVSAAPLYSNNFDQENGGVAAQSVSSLTGLRVFGRADLITSASGHSCSGLCLQLVSQVTNGAGTIGTIASVGAFSFNAGDTVKVFFDAEGAGTGPHTASISFNFYLPSSTVSPSNLGDNIKIDSFSSNLRGSDATYAQGWPLSGWVTSGPIDPNQAFKTYYAGFTAAQAGQFTFMISDFDTSTPSQFGPGTIFDNLRVEVLPAVPEPGSWALITLGVGLLGTMLRRKRRDQGAAALRTA